MTERPFAPSADGAPEDPSPAGPIQGVRIIDLTTIVLGPTATQLLGDLGADVIKVEPLSWDPMREAGALGSAQPTAPKQSGDIAADNEGDGRVDESGDPCSKAPPNPPGNSPDAPDRRMGAIFLTNNRNKRSLVLDLKSPRGYEAMRRLLQGADVFVHNMRPDALDRLGLGYEAVRKINPDIIHCGSYGYARKGPYGHKPAYDDLIQAVSGLAFLQATNDNPAYVHSVVADKVTGLNVVVAILAALLHRERRGQGQCIEVPMFESMVAFNMNEHLYGRTHIPARGRAGYPRSLSPWRRPYRTLDGWIGVMPYTDAQWQRLFDLAQRPDLSTDPRFASIADRLAHIDEVYETLADIIGKRSTADWLKALDAADIPSTPVNRPDDLIDDPHLKATGFWQEVEHPTLGSLRMPGATMNFSKTPFSISHPPPLPGEHSAQVLGEIGYDPEQIESLVDDGIVFDGGQARTKPADQEKTSGKR
ncbi:CaiB/BaiF CoA transferase family protein [Thioalkalivibrio sp. HK1]|uniref:CaiB/BaiF CoA transferase family protein n=1 Tax=Thioalkalivibrio sp. HK1 TaxID=1469245 RepID=UPI0018CC06B9|nr:CoA transferase [Thioalkalivibrio sp. HK1]